MKTKKDSETNKNEYQEDCNGYNIDFDLPELESVDDFMVLYMKEIILQDASEAIDSVQHFQRREKRINNIRKNLKKILTEADDDMYFFDLKKELLELQERHYYLQTNTRKIGRQKTDRDLASSILRACILCEQFSIDRTWLQQLFLPNNLFHQILKGRYEDIPIHIPLPSNQAEDKTWYYNFKLSLERTLFGGEDSSIASPSFKQKKELFYQEMTERNKTLNQYVIRNLDKLKSGEIQFFEFPYY